MFLKIFSYGLIGLMPIFFLGLGQSRSGLDNFGKILLLQFALALIFTVLAYRPARYFPARPDHSLPDIALALWLAAGLVSALAGNSFYTSFWGSYGTLSAPLSALLALALWYFFIKESKGLVKTGTALRIAALSGGSVLALLALLFSLAGLGAVKPDNPLFDLARFALGHAEQLSIYLAWLAVLFGGYLTGKTPDRPDGLGQSLFFLFSLAASLAFLVFFNFLPAWICLGVGLVFLILAGGRRRIAWLLPVLALSGFFMFFHLLNPAYYPAEQRLAPRLQLSWNATKDTALRSLGQKPLLGHGQEMFAAANSLLREPAANAKPYWYVRFNRGSSYLFEQLVYGGLIGFVFFGSFLLLVLYSAARLSLGPKKNDQDGANPALSALAAVSAAALVVYEANFLILFFFFTFLALLSRRYQKRFPLRPAAAAGQGQGPDILRPLIFILAGLVFVSLAFNFKHALAAYHYESGRKSAGAKQAEALESAFALNPRVYQYPLMLSEYHHKNSLAALKQAAGADDQRVQETINRSVFFGEEAIKAAPYAVASYENLAKIYRDLSAYSPDAYLLSAGYFRQAIEKEPSNPVLWTEAGNVYLSQGNAAEAIEFLSRARSLKARYYQADYSLAKALIAAGQNAAALNILDELALEYSNIDVLYEQGRASFNLKDYERAIGKFGQVVSIEPLHANALYSLGLSYAALGELSEAMYYLKKTADLNPDNFKLLEQIRDLEESR